MDTSSTINQARWQRLTDLINDSLALPLGQRHAFLTEQCKDDADLLSQVQDLLQDATETDDFLETAPDTQPALQDEIFGTRFGAYRVTGEIARGGMGAVLKAVRDDDTYQKVVAIKIVRSTVGGTKVVERFKAERQILATLNHPHIVHVIDGGTTRDGRPYFVMDFIDGEPIDAHCARNGLSIPQRLALFRTVCETVHFAHQRLIVHRDLKPSNILVDQAGQVKLLDFGIAKLLDAESIPNIADFTIAHAMTPAYASPEQIKRATITTASDIYALGVILYRLLTGRSPYNAEPTSPIDLAREILETDPQRPSTVVFSSGVATDTSPSTHIESARLRRTLQGDLDNIVMMALRKEPNRRYASAEQMAEDVRRFLAHEPVVAHQDSFGYRARKFVRRNRWATAFAAASVVALTSVTIFALHQAQQATLEKNRAETHFSNVRKLANASIFEVPNAIKKLPGSAKVQKQLIENAIKYLDGLAAEKEHDVRILAELGAGYVSLSQIEGSAITQSNLGNVKAGRKSLELGVSYLRTAHQKLPTDSSINFELSHALRKLAEFEWYQQQFEPSAKAINEAVSFAEAHQKVNSAEEKNRVELAVAYVVKARTSPAAKTPRDVRESFVNKAIEILKPMSLPGGDLDRRKKALQNLSVAYTTKAEIISDPTDAKSAERAFAIDKEGTALSEQLLALDPQNPSYIQSVAASYYGLGASASNFKLVDDAIVYRQRSSKLYGELSKFEPNDHNVTTQYAYTLSLLAEALAEKDVEAADVEVKRSAAIHSKIPIEHQGTLYFRATTMTIAAVESFVAAARSQSSSLSTPRRSELCKFALVRYRDARKATEPLKELFLDQAEDPIAALKTKMELCRPVFGASIVL
jgi:eukaryotic-like serine/threonine-protein kinase